MNRQITGFRRLRKATIGGMALASLSLGLSLGIPSVAHSQDAQAQSEFADRIPAEEFIKTSNMRTVRISPDGKRLAYIAGIGGQSSLVTLNLDTMQQKLVLASTEAREAGERTMAGFRWIGSEHIVITTISRENLSGSLSDFRRLVAYNVNNGELVRQAWARAGGDAGVILHIDHDTGNYLLQRDALQESRTRWGLPEVVEVNVSTGKFKIVQRTNPVVRGWAVDSEGEIRAGFNSSGESGKFRMLYKAQGDRNLKTVFNEADSTFTESVPTPRLFIPGTDLAYTISNHEGVDKVYKINMKTLTPTEMVFETEGFDIQGMITDSIDSKVLGFRTFDGTMRNVYTDPTLKALKGLLEEVFGKDEAQIIDYTPDFSKVVAFGGGKTKAGAFYLFDTQTGALRLLNWQRAAIKDAPLNPVKAEWYTASDGTKMQSVVTYPRHRLGQKNLPVVVMPHGGPFGALSATNQNEPWSQPLAEQGYIVIQPNYRGSGGYGKDFVKIGREPGGYGKRMQDDLNDILTYYGQKGVIDPNRACVMGWSYGGYAAARGAQRDPNLWKCAIAGAGVYDMPLMNKWDERNLGRFSSGFQATSEDPEAISPARNTDGQWSPILIVAAERDARIPMEQAETLVRNLRKSGKVEGRDFRYIVQEQGTHNLPYDDVHAQWINESYAWLERFNPAYTAADTDTKPPLMKVQ